MPGGLDMRYILLVLMIAVSGPAIAQAKYASRTSADEAFVANPKETPSMIRWVVVDDPDAECRAAHKSKNDFAERPGKIRACARYNSKSCTIITGPETSHALLGHELRHCFEGRFHD